MAINQFFTNAPPYFSAFYYNAECATEYWKDLKKTENVSRKWVKQEAEQLFKNPCKLVYLKEFLIHYDWRDLFMGLNLYFIKTFYSITIPIWS